MMPFFNIRCFSCSLLFPGCQNYPQLYICHLPFMKIQSLLTSFRPSLLSCRLLSNPIVVEHMKSRFVSWGCDVLSPHGYTFVLTPLIVIMTISSTNSVSPSQNSLFSSSLSKKTRTVPPRSLASSNTKVFESNSIHPRQPHSPISRGTSRCHRFPCPRRSSSERPRGTCIQFDRLKRQRQEEERRLMEEQRREYEAAVEADRRMVGIP